MTIPIVGTKRAIVQIKLELPPGLNDQAAIEMAVRSISVGATVVGWVREISGVVLQPGHADGPRG